MPSSPEPSSSVFTRLADSFRGRTSLFASPSLHAKDPSATVSLRGERERSAVRFVSPEELEKERETALKALPPPYFDSVATAPLELELSQLPLAVTAAEMEDLADARTTALEAVNESLSAAIMERYEAFKDANRHIVEVSERLDEARSTALAGKDRLALASGAVSHGIRVWRLNRRKKAMTAALDALLRLRRALQLQMDLRDALSEGDFCRALQLQRECRQAGTSVPTGVEVAGRLKAEAEEASGAAFELIQGTLSAITVEFQPDDYQRVLMGYTLILMGTMTVEAVPEDTWLGTNVVERTVDPFEKETTSFAASKALEEESSREERGGGSEREQRSKSAAEENLNLLGREEEAREDEENKINRRKEEEEEEEEMEIDAAAAASSSMDESHHSEVALDVEMVTEDISSIFAASPAIAAQKVVRGFLMTKASSDHAFMPAGRLPDVVSQLTWDVYRTCLARVLMIFWDIMHSYHNAVVWHESMRGCFTRDVAIPNHSGIEVAAAATGAVDDRNVSTNGNAGSRVGDSDIEGSNSPKNSLKPSMANFGSSLGPVMAPVWEGMSPEEGRCFSLVAAAAERGLQQCRRIIWDEMSRAVSILVGCRAALESEDFLQIVAWVRRFADIGEQFSGTEAVMLRASVQKQVEAFFESFHESNLEALDSMLAKESWKRLPFDCTELKALTIEIQQAVVRSIRYSDTISNWRGNVQTGSASAASRASTTTTQSFVRDFDTILSFGNPWREDYDNDVNFERKPDPSVAGLDSTRAEPGHVVLETRRTTDGSDFIEMKDDVDIVNGGSAVSKRDANAPSALPSSIEEESVEGSKVEAAVVFPYQASQRLDHEGLAASSKAQKTSKLVAGDDGGGGRHIPSTARRESPDRPSDDVALPDVPLDSIDVAATNSSLRLMKWIREYIMLQIRLPDMEDHIVRGLRDLFDLYVLNVFFWFEEEASLSSTDANTQRLAMALQAAAQRLCRYRSLLSSDGGASHESRAVWVLHAVASAAADSDRPFRSAAPSSSVAMGNRYDPKGIRSSAPSHSTTSKPRGPSSSLSLSSSLSSHRSSASNSGNLFALVERFAAVDSVLTLARFLNDVQCALYSTDLSKASEKDRASAEERSSDGAERSPASDGEGVDGSSAPPSTTIETTADEARRESESSPGTARKALTATTQRSSRDNGALPSDPVSSCADDPQTSSSVTNHHPVPLFERDIGFDLRTVLVRRSVARLLPLSWLTQAITAQSYALAEPPSAPGGWTAKLARSLELFGAQISGLEKSLPWDGPTFAWCEAATLVADAIVDGICQVRVCTLEGRAGMSLDVSSVGKSLSKLAPAQAREEIGTRMRFADDFVKAFYVPMFQLAEWAVAHPGYSKSRLLGLASCMAESSGLKKKDAAVAVSQVDVQLQAAGF